MLKYAWKEINIPNWEPVSFAASCKYKENLLLTGGWNPSTNSFNSNVWICDTEFRWKLLSNVNSWIPRNGHSLTKFNKKLYLIGGFNYQLQYLEDIWVYNPEESGEEWKCLQESSPWEGREGHVTLVFNNSLWIFGGITSSGVKNDIWSTRDGINWKQHPKIPPWSPRCFHNIVSFNDKLWLFTGSANEGAKNDLFVSTNGSDWKLVNTSLPFTPRFGSGAYVYDERIWMLGGSDAKEREFTNEVWWFTEEEGWNQFATDSPWTPRWGFNCVQAYNDAIVMMCGGVRYPDRKYSAYTDAWNLYKK